MAVDNSIKLCTKCGETKPLSDFYQHSTKSHWCIHCAREYGRNYYQDNKNKFRIRYIEKRGDLMAYSAEYQRVNPDRVRAWNHKRRGAMRSDTGFSASDIQNLLSKQQCKCAYCKVNISTGYHADHVVPVAKNGRHIIENIQLLCRSCNQRKGAKDPFEFANEIGKLL